MNDGVATATSTIGLWLAGTLVLGLLGTELELLLLGHYDDPWQLVPLVLIVMALGVMGWDGVRCSAASVRALRGTMLLFVVASIVGVVLHFRGAAAFQLEMNPTMPMFELVKKVMRVKDPPLLAPGVMLQLALVGLVYASCCRAPLVTKSTSRHQS